MKEIWRFRDVEGPANDEPNEPFSHPKPHLGPQPLRKMFPPEGKGYVLDPKKRKNDNQDKMHDVMGKLADLLVFIGARKKDMPKSVTRGEVEALQEKLFKPLTDEALLREVVGIGDYPQLEVQKIPQYHALHAELKERKLIE